MPADESFKPLIYLAGPMSGCNEAQLRDWREEVKSAFRDEFDFLDPCDNIVGKSGSHHEVIRADLEAISRADAVLAYMWKESIGTSHGVIHARSRGNIVVVVDPNRIQNRTLAFYADAVTRTLHEGMNVLRRLMATKRAPFEVVKQDGSREPFQIAKLIKSLRSACTAASKSDILVPVWVIPRSLDRIADYAACASGTVPTKVIREAVWEMLAECESDPLLTCDYAGIRAAWEQYDQSSKSIRKALPQQSDEAIIAEKPLNVRIFSAEHSTIWGKRVVCLGDVPEVPRRAFETAFRVEGIEFVRLGPFSSIGSVSKCHIKLFSSTTPGIIEGEIFDNGTKGSQQSFQIHVHDPSARDAILRTLTSLLYRTGYLRSKEFPRP